MLATSARRSGVGEGIEGGDWTHVILDLRDLRALVDVRAERVAEPDLPRLLRELREEGIVDPCLDEDARPSAAIPM